MVRNNENGTAVTDAVGRKGAGKVLERKNAFKIKVLLVIDEQERSLNLAHSFKGTGREAAFLHASLNLCTVL